MQRVILTTGGTGGHIFPALAVAEELKTCFPHIQILFVGGTHGPEAELATRANLEFVGLPARGILGRKLKAVFAMIWMIISLAKAWHIVARFKPDAVIGFGGYAAFATVLVSAIRGSITAIHEQNSIPGASNRLLSRVVKRVFLSLPDKRSYFPRHKTRLSGNPVRSAIRKNYYTAQDLVYRAPAQTIAKVTTTTKNSGGRILVLGGSQGSWAVNTAILTALPILAKAKVEIWHQCGHNDSKRVMRRYADTGLALKGSGEMPIIRVETFIEDMAAAYTWADLVVCRAGATTIAELTVASKPAVLIPFPFATQNHQFHNARLLEQSGAALLVEEKTLNRINLGEVIIELLTNTIRRAAMSRSSRKLARPTAASAIVAELQHLSQCTPPSIPSSTA